MMVAVILFTSCNKDEEALTPTDLTEKYLMTSGSNTADLFRYNFFNKYQSKILFEFDLKDYWYAMNSATASNDSIDYFYYVMDTAKQRRALQFMNTQWLLFYPAAIKQSYLPQYIFPSDRLFDYSSSTRTSTLDSNKRFKTNGFNNIILTGLGNRFDTMSSATKTILRDEMHFGWLYNWIYLRNKSFFPQAFYDVSAAKYGVSPRDSISTVYNDYLKNGFFPPVTVAGITYPAATTLSTTRYQSQDEDVAQFLRFIVQKNDATVNTVINNTNAAKVKQKYLILLDFFTSKGIDIRSINTTNIANLGPLDVY